VRFPVTIRHRTSKAKIYAPAGKFAYYRVAFTAAGKRKMQTFAVYSDAKAAAERIVRDAANGSQAAALSASQSRDALAAMERLDGYFKAKGKRISLNTAVGDYLDALGKLNVPLSAAVAGYLNTVATVKRMDLAAAVKEFVDGREAETKSVNGKRPELSKNYFQITKLWLGWFEKTFPATAVCDLTKEHLDLFMAGRSHLAAKSKNHLRATVKMFLNWCVKRDYVPANHRLLDAAGMKRQKADSGETDFYRPAELQALLDAANDTMRPIIALQGLAGIRLQEAQRLVAVIGALMAGSDNLRIVGAFLAGGCAFLLGNILPTFRWNDIVSGLKDEQMEWTRIFHGYDGLLRMSQILDRDEMLEHEFQKIEELRRAADLNDRNLPEDKALLDKLEAEVRKFYRLDDK
jgi:hypothetical protein